MRRYLILYLIISAFTAVALVSCTATKSEAFATTPVAERNYDVSYFSNAETDYVYKANIAVYGREFGGIMIVKKVSDTAHRVAFTTEFGNTLFDFEVTSTDFKVNYILEELDRKMVVNTLKSDFMLLLKRSHAVTGQSEIQGHIVYKTGDDKKHSYLLIDSETNKLVKLVQQGKGRENVAITYVAKSDILAENIVIDHTNIELKIELNYMNE